MAAVRAGKGAALVAEEFALDQLGRDRGAVDGDKRLSRPRRAGVEKAGTDLLADAAFAGEEDVAVDGGDAYQHRLDPPHGGRDAELAGGLWRTARGQLTQALDQRLHLEGLEQIVHRAGADETHRLGNVAIGGDEQEGGGGQRHRPAEQGFPVHVGQADVAHHHRRLNPLQSREGLAATAPPQRRETLELEALDQGFAEQRIILNQRYARS